MIRFTSFFISIAFLSTILSCGKKPSFDTPYSDNNPAKSVSTLEQLAAETARRAPDQPLFWGRTDVTIHDQLQNRKYRFDATLIYGEPDKMRIRGNHFLIGNLFEIAMGPTDSWVYIAEDRVLYEGSTVELQNLGGIFGSLSPDQLIGSIRVFHEMNSVLNSTEPVRFTESKNHLYLINETENQQILRKIRKDDGLVRETVLLDKTREDRIVLKVEYTDYDFYGEDDQVFPSDLRIHLPDFETEVRLEVTELKLDPPLRHEVILSLPRRVEKRFPLEALRYQEPVLPEE